MENLEERKKQLKALQNESLGEKIQNTMAKIMEFYRHTDGECYLSCSGGADSMVLYDIITRFVEPIMNCKFKVVFDDTGLEYPSVRATALAIENICVVKPEKSFMQVLTEIGYPLISKEVSECVNQARMCLERERERDTDFKNFLEQQNKKMEHLANITKQNINLYLMHHLE